MSAPEYVFDPQFLGDDAAEDVPHAEFLEAGFGDADDAAEQREQQYDNPDPSFIKTPPRKRNAAAYERKVSGLLQIPFRYTVAHEATVPDAAALFMYGPGFSKALGNWAANDESIARGIDWLTTGSDNPAAQAVTALAPLVLQIIRNHEPQLETVQSGIRLPGKNKDGTPRRLKIRFGVKLRRLRPLTNDPAGLSKHVFTNPQVRAQLAKQGITVAGFTDD